MRQYTSSFINQVARNADSSKVRLREAIRQGDSHLFPKPLSAAAKKVQVEATKRNAATLALHLAETMGFRQKYGANFEAAKAALSRAFQSVAPNFEAFRVHRRRNQFYAACNAALASERAKLKIDPHSMDRFDLDWRDFKKLSKLFLAGMEDAEKIVERRVKRN